MNLQLTASPEHEDLVKELRNDIDKNLEPVLHPNECCIYRVHEKLRNENQEAYTPQMVSIGPLHYGNEGLANMEKIKRRYMKYFLGQRITMEKQDEIFRFVKNKENKIRNCYAEVSNLKSHEYIMMILYDAIFIIELFMRNYEIIELFTRNYEETSDSFLFTMTGRATLMSDLELLENQLPYFVLEEIYKLTSYSNMPAFIDISCSFFGYFKNLGWSKLTSPFSVKHFTDWRRSILLEKYVGSTLLENYRSTQMKRYVESYSENGDILEDIWDFPGARKLHEFGVKFRKTEAGKLLFEKHRHELQLPKLQKHDESERIFRNVMALEQWHYPFETHICSYVHLMDCFIDTEKDVNLLVESKIITIFTGDESSVANMFNKLCRNIGFSPSCYWEIGQELKNHCDNPWNKKLATLRRVYFSDLWRGTGTIAAALLLLLTIIQTICSILQV